MKFRNLFLSFIFFFGMKITAQETDIVPYLKMIESGNARSVQNSLPKLKSENPNDPSLMFLDAVLTPKGEEALTKYESIYSSYPESKYADAALYRVFSYYYSMGYYTRAEEYLNKLKNDFPSSPYINAADRNIPDTEEVALQTTPAAEASPVNLGDFNFTIQAGAFLNIHNAMNLNRRFEADGYFSKINTKEVGGSILNVVFIGRFKTESEAPPVLTYLKDKYNLTGRVVPYSK